MVILGYKMFDKFSLSLFLGKTVSLILYKKAIGQNPKINFTQTMNHFKKTLSQIKIKIKPTSYYDLEFYPVSRQRKIKLYES